jgi:DNA-binding MarR family transcriptional regulator
MKTNGKVVASIYLHVKIKATTHLAKLDCMAKPSTSAPPVDVVDRLVEEWRRERPDIDPGAMAVIGRLIRLGRRMEADAASAVKAHGLHYTDFDVLATLRRVGSPHVLTPGELQQSVLLTSGAMTACLNRLEVSGLVARRKRDEDGRTRPVALTPAGRKRIDQAIVDRFEVATAALKPITRAESRQLEALLRKLSR